MAFTIIIPLMEEWSLEHVQSCAHRQTLILFETGRLSSENIVAFGDHLYSVPEPHLDFLELSILRLGLYLGEKKPGRFQPGQALALALTPESVSSYLSLSPEDPLLERYLHGEAIPSEGPNGWVLIGIEEFPPRLGKTSSGFAQNHYPKELRNR